VEVDKVVAEIKQRGQQAVAFQLNVGEILAQPCIALAETMQEQSDTALNIYYKGVFFLTQKALSFLSNGGRFINIYFGLKMFSNHPSSAYGAMKAAIELLTKYLAKERGSLAVRQTR